MFHQMTLPGFAAPISSPGLQDGPKPCASPTGPNGCHSGPAHPPASRSAPQESETGATMRDTSAPDLSSWSGPAAPLCCSASRSPARTCSDRLQALANAAAQRNLHGRGSTIYSIASKQQDTPHGRLIFRLRASARRTSGKGASSPPSICDLLEGWATCTVKDADGARTFTLDGAKRIRSNAGPTMVDMALLAGWATASARDWKDSAGMATQAENPDGTVRSRLDQLGRQVFLAGWPTPVANDDNKSPEAHLAMKKRMGERDGTGANRDTITSLQVMAKFTSPARLTASGELLTGSLAGMEAGGQLNPDLSRWLMGYPAAWGSCGATAMQSCRQQGRRRSKSPERS